MPPRAPVSRGELMRSRHCADSEEMGPRLLVSLALILTLATACSLQSRDEKVSDCERGFLDEARKVTGGDSQYSSAEARAKIQDLCGKFIDAGMEDVDSEEDLLAFVQDRPELAGDMCAVTAPSAYAALPAGARRYVTLADMERFARESCRYAAVQGEGALEGNFDFSGLLKAHPEIAEPFCVAGMLDGYDTSYGGGPKAAVRRRGFVRLAHRVCNEAISSGIVDFSSGVAYPQIDRARMARLLTRTLAQMRKSGEL